MFLSFHSWGNREFGGGGRSLSHVNAGHYTISNVEGLKDQLKSTQTLLVDYKFHSRRFKGGKQFLIVDCGIRKV